MISTKYYKLSLYLLIFALLLYNLWHYKEALSFWAQKLFIPLNYNSKLRFYT